VLSLSNTSAVMMCCAQQEKPKLFAKDEKIDHKKVDDKLRELVSGRGKKGTDRSRHIESLSELRQLATDTGLGEALDCKILFAIVAAIFDYNPNIATSMKTEMWEKWVHVTECWDCHRSVPFVLAFCCWVILCNSCCIMHILITLQGLWFEQGIVIVIRYSVSM